MAILFAKEPLFISGAGVAAAGVVESSAEDTTGGVLVTEDAPPDGNLNPLLAETTLKRYHLVYLK